MEELIQLKYALNTFYLLIAAVLVMWMAAGFSMLEGGLVRSKNTVEILTKNLALYAIACLMYLFCGYALMYGKSESSIIPHFGIFLGQDHTKEVVLSTGGTLHSLAADFFYQVVFAATAMSVVSGAVAERMKLWSFLLFAVVMTGFIYPVQGFWKWGGGFLDQLGFLDFAGAGVVHLAGATAAFTGVLLLGPRKGKYGLNRTIHPIPGANIPMAALGTLILWMGWFGFNGGSQLAIASVENANAVAKILVNTNLAGAAGLIAALLLAQTLFGKADLTMALNGALAGLVAITAEPFTPSPLQAVLIGGAAGLIIVLMILLMDRLRMDDPVGAISVHGVSGIWGLLMVSATNPQASLLVQLQGIGTIIVWVGLTSLTVWFLIKIIIGLRVTEEEEYKGMDIVDCGMEAYPEFTASASNK